MPTWKKVLVSGSAIEVSQLNVEANQQITPTQATTFLTGSFTGSFTGNGANLTGVTATAVFPTTQLTPLTSTTQLFANDGSNKYVTVGQVTASAYAGVSGDITISNAGVAAIGSGVIVDADIDNSAAIAASKINFAGTNIVSGSSIASSAQGEVTLTTNGVAASAVDLGLQTSDSPTFVGLTLTSDLAVNGADITTTSTGTATLFNTNATTVNIAGAGTTVNIGNASGTTTIAGNGIVQGDFTVNGTLTYLNVQDLYVEDKFIVLASGSATAGDGGIMIDRGSDAAGNIGYGFDSITDRWGFQSGLTDTTNTFDPTSASGVSGSFVPYLFTEASHGAIKPVTGEFAVLGSQYMDAAGNFWVYTA